MYCIYVSVYCIYVYIDIALSQKNFLGNFKITDHKNQF